MKATKIIVAAIASGIVYFIVSQIIQAAISAVLPYNVLALAGMRSVNDPIMLFWFLHPIVLGLTMAIIYDKTKKAFTGSTTEKGIEFGSAVWMVAGLPSAFLVWSSMDYPLGFTMSALIGTAISTITAGIIIAKIMEK